MAIPLIGSAVGALMRRYGMKGLKGAAKSNIKKKAKRQADYLAKKESPKASRKDAVGSSEMISKRERALRRKQVAGNVAGDVGTVAIAGEAINSGMDVDKYESKEALERFVKNEKPKLWKQYADSEYDDITEFLKSMKG